jgi:predicted nucleic acid-binding protein
VATKYALDTNVYVDSLRSVLAAERLKRFFAANLQSTHLLAVVMQELRAGARTAEQIDSLESDVFGPFERRNRVIVPTVRGYKESGRILSELAIAEKIDLAHVAPSFVNDTLIAACCRHEGITLITGDKDYGRITRYLKGFRHIAPPFL